MSQTWLCQLCNGTADEVHAESTLYLKLPIQVPLEFNVQHPNPRNDVANPRRKDQVTYATCTS